MQWPRAGGILVHPTSFPGEFGIGDLGPGALRLLDFLRAGQQTLWQALPLGPTGYGNSPYASLSAFAGNPMLISPERLLEDDLLTSDQLWPHPDFPAGHVDYGRVIPWKDGLLRASHARFQRRAPATRATLRDEYDAFCEAQAAWLDDYALFAALKAQHKGAPWTAWDEPLALRDPQALDAARGRLGDEIAYQKYAQFLFFRQWKALRAAARERGIRVIGDLAIFVAHDSADVWAHRDLFSLDAHGWPTVVAGVPPDYFSETGQRWGNPLYRWETLAQTGYAWWIERTRRALELEDYIRLDHFRGFEAYWEVPASEETAMNGRWVPGPGAAVFEAIRAALGEAPFIAEDLGLITESVHALRRRLGFPSMRVLQFAFSGDSSNDHLPHHFTHEIIVYTGTHDNDTTRGWFETRSPKERAYALRYLDTDERQIAQAMLRAAYASVANLALAPLQDALDLGSQARMNFPSRPEGNWGWRCTADQLSGELAERLATLSATYGR